MELINNNNSQVEFPFKEEKNVALEDVHAPPETYYTTGSNAGHAINRLRTLSVNSTANDIDKLMTYFVIRDVKETRVNLIPKEKEELLMV